MNAFVGDVKIIRHKGASSAAVSQVSAVYGDDALAAAGASVADARGVVDVAVAVLVVAAVSALRRNPVQRLDDPNHLIAVAGDVDRVTGDVTVVVVQYGRPCRERERKKKKINL